MTASFQVQSQVQFVYLKNDNAKDNFHLLRINKWTGLKLKMSAKRLSCKRIRSRRDRVLAQKIGEGFYKKLDSEFQKEIDNFTTEDFLKLKLERNNVGKRLFWVCDTCFKPKEHSKGCARNHGKAEDQLRDIGTLLFGPTNAKEGQPHHLTEATGTKENDDDEAVANSTSSSQEMEVEVEAPAPSQQDIEASQSDRLSEFARLFFVHIVKPRLTSGSDKLDKSKIISGEITSWSFPFPTTLQSLSKLGSTMSNEAHILKKSSLIVVDFETFYPQFSHDLRCECGAVLTRNGFTTYCRVERGFTIGNAYQPVDYRCNKCPLAAEGNQSKSYTSLSEHVIAQLNPVVRSELDILVGGNGFLVSRQTVTLLQSLVMSGNSLENIEKASSQVIQTELAYKEKARLEIILAQKREGSVSISRVSEKTSLTEWYSPFILTSAIVQSIILWQFQRCEPIMQASFFESAVGHNVFQMDGCFPFGNGSTQQGVVSLHHVMNMDGEVVAGLGVTTKSPKEFVQPFTAIKEIKLSRNDKNPVRVLYTDNPAVDSGVVQEVFGPDCLVRKDVFHVISRIGELIKLNHEDRPSFMKQLSDCFFEYLMQDMEAKRQSMLESGLSLEEVDAIMSDPWKVERMKELRRKVRDGVDVVPMITKLFGKFAGRDLYLKDAFSKYEKMIPTIEKYVGECLDEGIIVWVNIGTPENPSWLVRRGTNMCENLHRFVNKLNLYRFSYELANALYVTGLFMYSHRSRVQRQGRDLLPFVYDIALMNDLVSLQASVKDHIDFPFILKGHRRLEAERSGNFCSGIIVSNDATAVEKAALHFRLTLEEYQGETLMFQAKTIFPKLARESAKDFPDDIKQPEMKLLRAYLKSSSHLSKKGRRKLSLSFEDLLTAINAKGKVEKYVKVEKIAIEFSFDLFEALTEERLVEKFGISVSTEYLSPKTTGQVSKGILHYCRVAFVALSRKNDPDLKPRTSTTSSPIKETLHVQQPQGPMPFQVFEGPEMPTRSFSIPMVPGEQLVQVSKPAREKRAKLSKDSSITVVLPDVDTPETEEKAKKHARTKCPDCGVLRHGKTAQCGYMGFLELQRSLPKDHPERARRKGGESENECWRRVYLESLAKSLL